MNGELVPLPETVEAVDDFGPFSSTDGDLVDELREQSRQVREVVPACVGMSITLRSHGATFTLVASSGEIAALDAVQYMADGPCIGGIRSEQVVGFTPDDPLAEGVWHLFARATAARSVASTLSLPILTEGLVVGSVNLYASTPDAFDGHHEEVAAILHAWAPGAVTNADLDFSTRAAAEHAPAVLRDDLHLQQALGVLMLSEQLDEDTARARIDDAAQRAGVSVTQVVETLIEVIE